ncbi:glycosyltransferase [bacterium]|nr:glycosyltransferase [bacterium]
MPLVTAIIPNYNHAGFLEQRIRSVLAQTFQDYEVLLLDDASTDNSSEVLERFTGHPRVRDLLLNRENSGNPFRQWNKGVAAANGRYIWMAESDDYADPRLLATLVPILEDNPAVGVAYCQSRSVDEDNHQLASLKDWTDDLDKQRWAADFIADGRDECCRYLPLKCTIPNASAVVFRRSVYEQAGGADDSFRLAGDWMVWSKLLLHADLAFIARELNYFRIHGNTVRNSSTKSAVALQEAGRILSFLEERVAIPADIRSQALDRLLNRWITELSKARFSPAVNYEIYRTLRRLDDRLHRRILTRLTGRLRKAIGRTGGKTAHTTQSR